MKRKVLSRVLAASMATVMTVGLAGCGNDSGNSGQGSTPNNNSTPGSQQASGGSDAQQSGSGDEEVSKYTVLKDENGNVYDLGGIEVQIRDWFHTDRDPVDGYEEERDEYREWAQKTYNFTVKEVAMGDWGSNHGDYQDYVTTGGDNNNYVFVLHSGAANLTMMQNNLMYDLSTLSCLDFSQEQYQASKLHEMYGNHATGAIYAMRPMHIEPRCGVYFNKRLMEEANIDWTEFYNLVENNQWTWDKFVEYCEKIHKDTDNDGVIDRWALVGEESEIKNGAVASNHAEYIGYENGKFVNKTEDPATLKALNWALDLMDKYLYKPEGAEWNWFIEAFQTGKTAFCIDAVYRASGDYGPDKMSDDFGFLPYPMSPDVSSYRSFADDNLYVIPSCYDADRAWKIAFAFDQWCTVVPGWEGYNEQVSGFYASFRDAESVDISVAAVSNGAIKNNHGAVPGIDFGNDYLWGIAVGGATPQQKAEECRDKWNDLIDKANQGIWPE